jgi:hypothetical protein
MNRMPAFSKVAALLSKQSRLWGYRYFQCAGLWLCLPPEAFEIIDANREELVQPEFRWIPAFLGRSIAAAFAKTRAQLVNQKNLSSGRSDLKEAPIGRSAMPRCRAGSILCAKH